MTSETLGNLKFFIFFTSLLRYVAQQLSNGRYWFVLHYQTALSDNQSIS
jgi:hypothetical protein